MIKRHATSFKNAYAGIVWVIKTQNNFRIHIGLSITAIIASWYFKITYPELLTIIVLIMVGLSVEMLNTAIEEATDAIDTTWRQDIKIAKDTAAGAMLVYSLGALVIAIRIFLPHVLRLFNR